MNRKEYGLLVESWRRFINESEDVDNMSNESSLRDYKSESRSALFQRIGLDISKLKEYNKDTRSQNDEISFYNKIHGKKNFEPLQIGGFGSGGYLYANAEHTRIKDSIVQKYINEFREVKKLEDDNKFYMFLENFALEKSGMMNSSLPRRNCKDENFIEIMTYIITSYIEGRYKAAERAGYGYVGVAEMRSGYISLDVFKKIVNEIEKTLDVILKKVEVKPEEVQDESMKFEVAEYIEDRLYDDFGFSSLKVLSVKEDREDKHSLYALVHCVDNNKWATIYQDDEGDQQIDDAMYDERQTRDNFNSKTTDP